MTAYIGGAVLIGVLLARQRTFLWMVPLLLFGGAVCYLECQAGRASRGIFKILLLLAGALLGALRYEADESFRNRYLKEVSEGMETSAEGLIYQKEIKNQNTIYYIKNTHLSLKSSVVPCNKIQIYFNDHELRIGDHILVSGKLRLPKPPSNEGNLDQKLYYESRKIDLIFLDNRVKVLESGRLPMTEWLSGVREKLRQVYEASLPELDAGILSTMLLGDKTLLNTDVKELYQSSGISHILAISGLHISLIGMLLRRLLRMLRMGELPASLGASLVLFLYTLMTGASPSAVRAFLMFFLACLAPAFRRSYDSLTALSLTMGLALLHNPFLTGYSGFVFSYAAVLSVTGFGSVLKSAEAEVWRGKADRRGGRRAVLRREGSGTNVLIERRVPSEEEGSARAWLQNRLQAGLKRFREALVISISIQLVTLPIVMWNYYEIPVFAMGLNLLILPLMGIVLTSGILGGLIGLIGWISGARIILYIPHLILYIYGHLCNIVMKLPGAELVTGKPSFSAVVIYYAVLCLVFILIDLLKNRKIAVISIMLILGLALIRPKHFELSILDVGQGDGIFLTSDRGGAVFIDGGSTDVKQLGKYRLLPFLKSKGIGKVDYWLVTHTDLDHISGLKEVLEEGYPVESLVFSKYVYEDEALESLIALAEKKGTGIVYLESGQSLHLGEAVLTCVFPNGEYVCEDKNGLSLVTVLKEADFSAILTGDISDREERYLTEKGEVPDIDFYKASHHGSRYGSSEEFLKKLSPEAAAISCGAGNRYGHPAKETLQRIEESGAEIYDTRFGGQIRVSLEKGKPKISRPCGDPGYLPEAAAANDGQASIGR